jgi:hypothetical protein
MNAGLDGDAGRINHVRENSRSTSIMGGPDKPGHDGGGLGWTAPYPTISASVKNWPISMTAFSGLSEPCTELPVKLSA